MFCINNKYNVASEMWWSMDYRKRQYKAENGNIQAKYKYKIVLKYLSKCTLFVNLPCINCS